MDPERIFPDEFVPNIEASDAYKRWAKSSPGDRGRWETFRSALLAGESSPPIPTMSTRFGRGLVAAGKEHMSVLDIGSAPPSTEALLPWAPPVMGEGGVTVVNWTMTNANRQSNSLLAGGGRDLNITSGEELTGPVMQLHNWRHVKWIGGKITDTGSGDHFALPISATGTIHLEGLDIRADGDGLMSRGGGPNCTWQIQNCRVEVHYNGSEHSDCFQSQSGSKINELRIARTTMLTDYQGIFLRLATADAYMNAGDFRELNFRRRSGLGDPDQAFLFVPDEDPETGHGAGQLQIGNTAMTNVWAEGSHSSASSIFYPSWIFETALASPPLGAFGNKEGLFRETDGTGQYVRPSTTSDTVPAGGSASGQQCESAGWTGIIRLGIPPGGDYCPAAVPGVSYISPGYA